MKGGGYGIVGDIIVGLIGSFVGGFLMGALTGGAYGLEHFTIACSCSRNG